MLVVSELDDVVLPLPQDLLVNLSDSRTVVDGLVEKLSTGMFGNTSNVETAFGPALDAAYKVMNVMGGKVIAFLSSLPSIGPNKLKNREDMRMYNTDAERTLLNPTDAVYKELALKFSNAQVAIDLFTATPQHIDLATLTSLCKLTGGQFYHYLNFRPEKSGVKLKKNLKKFLTRNTGFESIMRVKKSNGN